MPGYLQSSSSVTSKVKKQMEKKDKFKLKQKNGAWRAAGPGWQRSREEPEQLGSASQSTWGSLHFSNPEFTQGRAVFAECII